MAILSKDRYRRGLVLWACATERPTRRPVPRSRTSPRHRSTRNTSAPRRAVDTQAAVGSRHRALSPRRPQIAAVGAVSVVAVSSVLAGLQGAQGWGGPGWTDAITADDSAQANASTEVSRSGERPALSAAEQRESADITKRQAEEIAAQRAREAEAAQAREEEAARKREEEAARKREEEAAAKKVQAAVDDPRGAARQMLPEFGWEESQFSCLDSLWRGESNWDHTATNPSSGAYGIPQSLPASKMASAGADWESNPLTQIRWGLGYIEDVYGDPCSADNFKSGHGWY